MKKLLIADPNPVSLFRFVLLLRRRMGNDQPRESKASDRTSLRPMCLNEIQAAPDSGIPQEVLSRARVRGRGAVDAQGRLHRGREVWPRAGQLPHAQGLEHAGIFHRRGRQLRISDRRQAVDLVMLIMNNDGMRHLLADKFEMGADASVAAGPVGRHAEGNTDWTMRAQVLTYSRARGVFAGVSLNGAVLKQDKDSTREFYGHMMTSKAALTGEVEPTPAANPFLTTLAKWAQEAAK
jgi:SH3 domain-containing YSC84-like protein 1